MLEDLMSRHSVSNISSLERYTICRLLGSRRSSNNSINIKGILVGKSCIDLISTKICTPPKIAGTGIGLAMASGGSLLFTYFGNGNLKQTAVITFGGYFCGYFFWALGATCVAVARNCDPLPKRTRLRQLLESINKVMTFVLLGSFPAYGGSLICGYPHLTLVKGALYVGGVVAPFAALSTVLGIINDCKESYVTPPVPGLSDLEVQVMPE